jgi:DNA polymerase-3 subunit beta
MAARVKAENDEADGGAGVAGAGARPGVAQISVKALRGAMAHMHDVVETRGTIPILSCVLITVGPSTLTLTATDLDLQLRQQIDLAEAGSGQAMEIALNAGTLYDIVRKLPGDEIVELAQDPGRGRVRVSCGRTRYELPYLPAADFCLMVLADAPVRFEVARATLQSLFEAVAFAQSTEETRYYLNGIWLHAEAAPEGGAPEGEPAQLKAAATDGHRLALMSIDAPDGAEALAGLGKGGVIIGRKTVKILRKLLDSDEGVMADIRLSARQIVAEIGTVTLSAKLIDGEYPDYRRVIPAAHKSSLWIDPAALVTAVDRVATISADKTRLVRLDIANGMVRASVTSPENGTAEEEIEAELQGDDFAIGFNGIYLKEALEKLTAKPALLRMSDPASPTLLMDAEEARRLIVLMPMRV